MMGKEQVSRGEAEVRVVGESKKRRGTFLREKEEWILNGKEFL